MSLHDDLSKAHWRKASRSSASGSDCVELADVSGAVAIRDSKNPEGPALVLSSSGWEKLSRQLGRGEFDL